MSDTDTSYYETTYSEDERIEAFVKARRDKSKRDYEEITNKRKAEFERYHNSCINKKDSIFNYPGINFIRFNHKKIKFSFKPSEVVELVSHRVIFYVSMRCLHNRNWLILRDTIPGTYKKKIYRAFYKRNNFRTDRDIIDGLIMIYFNLVKWSEDEQEFRKQKLQKYKAGVEVELDSDDEEIFLTDEEKLELHSKREAILMRMVPPYLKRRRTRRFKI